MCNIPLPLVLLGVRRWLVRWRVWIQWVLTAVVMIATVLMLGYFISFIGP